MSEGTTTEAAVDVGAVLRGAIGEAHVYALDPPVERAGATLEWQAEPPDADALSRLLAALNEVGVGALVVGSGTRIDDGAPCPEARVMLSTRGLAGVIRFEEEEGVVEVGAGTRLLDVLDHLHGTMWELPLDAPGEETTVGGVLATAVEGPRRVAYGRVRRQVLGLEVVLADGTRARCGGRVVKNVTGYDLAKLHVGAEGTLGVIASAWLRLRPRPEATRTLAARFDDLAPACRAARLAARLPSARMATLLSGDLAERVSGLVDRSGAWVLAVELAGSEALCARDAATLEREAGANERSFSVDAVGAASLVHGDEAVHARAAVLPTHLEPALEGFRQEGLSVAAHPVPGVVEVALPVPRAEEAARVIERLDGVGRSLGGPIVFQRRGASWAPPAEVDETTRAETELWSALEASFDAHGILNAGRMTGGR